MVDISGRQAAAASTLSVVINRQKLLNALNQMISDQGGDVAALAAQEATDVSTLQGLITANSNAIAALTNRVAVANVNYTVTSANRLVAYTSLTTTRTVTLPAASAYPTGTMLLIIDEAGTCSNAVQITVSRAGSDLINGAGFYTLNTPNAFVALESDGSSKWTVVDQSNSSVSRTPVVDAAYTVTTKDRNVAYTSITAARVVTLPSAASFAGSATVTIYDESGSVSSTNTITINRAGSDTINGLTSTTINTAYGFVVLASNGSAKWTIVDQSAVSTAATRTPVADMNYTALSTDRYIAYTSLTAARTVALPSAASFPGAARLLVIDETGACSGTVTITLARSGSDLINGKTSYVLNSPFDTAAVESDGVSKWTIVDESGAQNDFATTLNPTINDDASKGFAAGSIKLRTDTGDAWRCRSAAVGAAVWVRMDVADFFGYVSGYWYLPYGITSFANGSATTVGTYRWLPWINKQRVTFSAIGVRIATVSSGGNVQVALYGSNTNNRPTGTPLATTASMSTTTATVVNSAVSVQIDPGIYWYAIACDNATAACVCAAALGIPLTGQLIGTATEGNVYNVGGVSLTFTTTGNTYGTFNDMTSTTLTEVATGTALAALPHMLVGSVP